MHCDPSVNGAITRYDTTGPLCSGSLDRLYLDGNCKGHADKASLRGSAGLSGIPDALRMTNWHSKMNLSAEQLIAIRDQLARSLARVHDLESQVRTIPGLYERINELSSSLAHQKEVSKLLQRRLSAKDLDDGTVDVILLKPSRNTTPEHGGDIDMNSEQTYRRSTSKEPNDPEACCPTCLNYIELRSMSGSEHSKSRELVTNDKTPQRATIQSASCQTTAYELPARLTSSRYPWILKNAETQTLPNKLHNCISSLTEKLKDFVEKNNLLSDPSFDFQRFTEFLNSCETQNWEQMLQILTVINPCLLPLPSPPSSAELRMATDTVQVTDNTTSTENSSVNFFDTFPSYYVPVVLSTLSRSVQLSSPLASAYSPCNFCAQNLLCSRPAHKFYSFPDLNARTQGCPVWIHMAHGLYQNLLHSSPLDRRFFQAYGSTSPSTGLQLTFTTYVNSSITQFVVRKHMSHFATEYRTPRRTSSLVSSFTRSTVQNHRSTIFLNCGPSICRLSQPSRHLGASSAYAGLLRYPSYCSLNQRFICAKPLDNLLYRTPAYSIIETAEELIVEQEEEILSPIAPVYKNISFSALLESIIQSAAVRRSFDGRFGLIGLPRLHGRASRTNTVTSECSTRLKQTPLSLLSSDRSSSQSLIICSDMTTSTSLKLSDQISSEGTDSRRSSRKQCLEMAFEKWRSSSEGLELIPSVTTDPGRPESQVTAVREPCPAESPEYLTLQTEFLSSVHPRLRRSDHPNQSSKLKPQVNKLSSPISCSCPNIAKPQTCISIERGLHGGAISDCIVVGYGLGSSKGNKVEPNQLGKTLAIDLLPDAQSSVNCSIVNNNVPFEQCEQILEVSTTEQTPSVHWDKTASDETKRRVMKNSSVPVSAAFLAACHTFAAWLEDSTTINCKTMNKAMDTLRRKWFEVTSGPFSSADTVDAHVRALKCLPACPLSRVINMADQSGNTALHYAVSYGRWSVVGVLLRNCPLLSVDKFNRTGYTPVMLAAVVPNQPANPEEIGALELMLLRSNLSLLSATAQKQSVLMLAAIHGRTELIDRLLATRKVPVNQRDSDGSTALMAAAEHNRTTVVRLLLSQKDIDTGIRDNDGYTALDIALAQSHHEIALMIYAKMKMEKLQNTRRSLRKSLTTLNSIFNSPRMRSQTECEMTVRDCSSTEVPN
ncbi:unnamed protein product [Calicophoron daubneyi]|uniref:Uncharacterized protein n=1 Tax=Calicophoron daubneyi TaxID=300641 RepID=A0AAV2TRA0_CALDB